MCILLIDDDERVRKSLAAFLRAEGFDVKCAAGAFAALEIARQSPYEVAAVLSDVTMPGMNGFQMWERMKAYVPPYCRVLFMTGDPDLVCGHHEHQVLSKPFAPNLLKQELRSAMTSAAA